MKIKGLMAFQMMSVICKEKKDRPSSMSFWEEIHLGLSDASDRAT